MAREFKMETLVDRASAGSAVSATGRSSNVSATERCCARQGIVHTAVNRMPAKILKEYNISTLYSSGVQLKRNYARLGAGGFYGGGLVALQRGDQIVQRWIGADFVVIVAGRFANFTVGEQFARHALTQHQ